MSPDSQLRSGFLWPQRFSQKRKIAEIFENKPWVSCQDEFNSPRDAISFFFAFDDDDVRYHGRVRPILDICQGLDLYDLPSIDSLDGEKRVAWLIDGQLVDGVASFRDCLGSLTARRLAEALSRPRYRNVLCPNRREQEHAREMTDCEETPAFDAERRLLYLTNLDCWSVLALIKTAPLSQAKLLGDFFHKHLGSRTSTCVSFEAWGRPMFSLEFHLPFRVWRKTKRLLKDERIKSSDHEALRSSRNVTYLMPPGDRDEANQVHGIYSGHISCLVSGHDYWQWTAYFSIDTWFDEEEGINDQVTRYDNDMEDESGCDFEPDPCSGGQDDARKPYWYPRVWFLRIFGIRLDQIKDEWEHICLHLGQSIDREDQKHKMLLREVRVSPELAYTEQHGFQVNTLKNLMLESRDVLQDLLSVVRETVKVGASFLSTDVNFFLNVDGQPGDASECYPYINDIRRVFNELSQLSFRLESYQEKCSSVIQCCEALKNNNPLSLFSPTSDERSAVSSHRMLQVQVEIEKLRNELIQVRLRNEQLIAIEPKDVEEVRVLAFSTLLTQAFSQTTALFSAEGVIAFTKNWQSFMISLLVAYGINISIGTAFLIWIRRARRRLQDACASKSKPLLPVVQPTQNIGAASTVTLRSSSETVTQGISTHISSTRFDEDGITVHNRRRFSGRLWLSYRQPERVEDIELGNRNALIVEELT